MKEKSNISKNLESALETEVGFAAGVSYFAALSTLAYIGIAKPLYDSFSPEVLETFSDLAYACSKTMFL